MAVLQGFSSVPPPPAAPELLLRFEEDRPDAQERMHSPVFEELHVLEGGRLRCEGFGHHVPAEVRVTGSSAVDHVKQLVDRMQASGVRLVPPKLRPGSLNIFLFGRGQAMMLDDDWRDLSHVGQGLFGICSVLSPHARP